MADRILHKTAVMISDLHVGSPENATLEDFDRDADFERLLLDVIPARAGGPATLIIAGDFIDFPQIFPELGKQCPHERFGTTEEESLLRVEAAIKGHPRVFDALRAFRERGNQVLVLPGNHDIDLHFLRVWGAIHEAAGGAGGAGSGALEFVREGVLRERGVYIEHGNQYAYDNWFEHWDNPIRDAPDGKRRVERPWGTFFMDIVYNDIEDVYPFVNKIYPHGLLARIVLRLMRDDPRVTIPALARLVAFFVTRGKTVLGGWALGAPEEAEGGAVAVSSIEDFVDEFGQGMAEERRRALVEQTVALTGAQPDVEPESGDEPEDGLLGRTDERGLESRALSLLGSGTVGVVAFGHTHTPLDREVELPRGPGRIVNTGGWIPTLKIDARGALSLSDIRAAARAHDIRYLVLSFDEPGRPPAATLATLHAGGG